jgi:acyl-CoA reductase-like NAD-dependent aldehyde dehydrogenase
MAEKRVVTADPNYTVPLLIEGKEVQSDVTFPVTSPTSQKELWKSSSVTLEHVKTATSAAQAAFPKWSKMKPAAKRDIFMKAADIIEARAVELAEYMKLETGATSPFADGFNVPKTADMLRDVAGRLSTITGSVPTCETEGTSAFIVKEPLGTVLAIAPW